MADVNPSSRPYPAPARTGIVAGRVGGMGPLEGGPFNIGWLPWAAGIAAIVIAIAVIYFRNRQPTAAQQAPAPSGLNQTGAQAATQQSAAPAAATLVPLPYPTSQTGTGTDATTGPGGVPSTTQPLQPAAQSLGTVTLAGQPTGGQQASTPGPPMYDPSTGQVISTAAGPFFQWGQQVQVAGQPTSSGITPVVGPSGGVVGIPTTAIASWNNPSAASLSSFSPTGQGQGQVTA